MRRAACHTSARSDHARATRLHARVTRGHAGRDFSSKLAWLDPHRICSKMMVACDFKNEKLHALYDCGYRHINIIP